MTKFISVEGGECVGKSSFIAQFTKKIVTLGIEIHPTCEPGGTALGQRLRDIFVESPDGQMHILTEFLLISAARAQHVHELIKNKLSNGYWVISDRFADSSRVYQGILGGIASESIEFITDVATSGLVPDLSFLLDCDIKIIMERIKSRKDLSRFDAREEDYHRQIQKAYRNLAQRNPERIVTLDASKTTHEMVDDALNILRDKGLLR